MNDVVGFIAVILSVTMIVAYINAIVVSEYPANPLRWAQKRRRRLETARVRRISALEHDLGYIPCSNDKCYSCKRTFDTQYIPSYTNEFVALAYDKAIEVKLWK